MAIPPAPAPRTATVGRGLIGERAARGWPTLPSRPAPPAPRRDRAPRPWPRPRRPPAAVCPPSPRAASRARAVSTSVMTETSRNPGRSAGRRGAPGRRRAPAGPRSTSSTMPEPGGGGVTEEHRPQRVRGRLQQGRPVAPEPLVHEHGEPQTVAPEAEALLHVAHADRRMVHHGHRSTSRSSRPAGPGPRPHHPGHARRPLASLRRDPRNVHRRGPTPGRRPERADTEPRAGRPVPVAGPEPGRVP